LELSQVIHRRRMVRSFARTAIPDDALERVLESALHAPSAGFAQGTELIVLDQPKQIARFWQITDPRGRKRPAEKADPPVIVIPLAGRDAYLRRYTQSDKRGLGLDVAEGWPVPYWELDAAMAVMLMLLSAVDQGLGAWYFGIFAGKGELLQWLGVPDGYRPIGAVGLGYPAAFDRARGSALSQRRRSLEDVVHRGGWSR
jgi:nitroreductase